MGRPRAEKEPQGQEGESSEAPGWGARSAAEEQGQPPSSGRVDADTGVTEAREDASRMTPSLLHNLEDCLGVQLWPCQ